MSKRPEVRVALEKLLRDGQARNERKVLRDRHRRPVLVDESVLDPAKLLKAGKTVSEVGRRIRCYDADMKKETGTWLAPVELAAISRDEPDTVDGVALPFGKVVSDDGLWLQHHPGYAEIGVNDRGEVLLRALKNPDPQSGPVAGSVNTTAARTSPKIVPILDPPSFDETVSEARAWMKVLAALDGKRPTRHQFKCAGIDFEQHGNVPLLHRCAEQNFFGVRDIEMVRIASLIAFRFRKLRRTVPKVTILCIDGVPGSAREWNALQKKIASRKKSRAGLPDKIAESRFFDAQTKGIPGAVVVGLGPLRDLPAEIVVISINSDDHAVVRNHAVLASLTAILFHIDVIMARAAVAVLNESGTATAFIGPTGSGKSTGALFWAGKGDGRRRRELRRRYEAEIRRTPDAGRLGEAGIQKELDGILSRVGILCQEDSVGILKEGAGYWMCWATEHAVFGIAAGFPRLSSILSDNRPLLLNVRADFGASGSPDMIGRVTHAQPSERLFYDPSWGQLLFDGASRRIGVNLLLDRRPGALFVARKLTAQESTEWLLKGSLSEERFEPLCNPRPFFAALLTQMGVVGPALTEAYEKGRAGDFTLLGGGDARLGEIIFERLDLQVKLWLDNCRETPTYLIDASRGLELTQDVCWLLSQHPELFGEWREVKVEQFVAAMKERYGVTYGAAGQWSHIPPGDRLSD